MTFLSCLKKTRLKLELFLEQVKKFGLDKKMLQKGPTFLQAQDSGYLKSFG